MKTKLLFICVLFCFLVGCDEINSTGFHKTNIESIELANHQLMAHIPNEKFRDWIENNKKEIEIISITDISDASHGHISSFLVVYKTSTLELVERP